MDQQRPLPLIEPDQEVEIDLFRPADAQGVADCFLAVYGPDYPVRTYYEPEQLIAAVERGEIVCVVSRTAKGEIVGVTNMFRMAPFEGVYEVGAGLVLPSYRNRRFNSEMIRFFTEKVIPLKGIAMGFGEAVLNHVFQQKTQKALGYTTMAFQVDLMPAAAYSTEKTATGRVAATMAFRDYQPHHRQVLLPPRYAQSLRYIYAGMDLDREFREADPGAELQGESRLDCRYFDFARTARVTLHHTGSDLEQRVGQLMADLRGKGAELVQIWLNLASPGVAAAVEVLRPLGFYLGGVMPRWFDDDGLLLQNTLRTPNWAEIQIWGQRNQDILDMVRQDWESLPRI